MLMAQDWWPHQDEFSVPKLTISPAEKPNGAGVLVFPGGGYSGLATDHEGAAIIQWLNERGYGAWMLEYATASDKRPMPLLSLPLKQAQRALRWVRAHASEAKVEPGHIGIWGFSAGGHLASTLATHYDDGQKDGDDVERWDCRPAFQILAYPVVTMGAKAHGGSRNNLLGKEPSAELIELYSNELQVNAQTPPAFLFHTADDPAVPIENSLDYFSALHKNGVKAEMHVYQHGRHGVGLAQGDGNLKTWPTLLENWLRTNAL